MPPENQSENPDNSQPDPLKNIKEEFNRKLGNTETQIADLAKTNQALVAQLQALQASLHPQKPQQQGKKVSVFDDEDAFRTEVTSEVERRIDQKLNQQQAMQAKQAQIMGELLSEFPELNDPSNDLRKRALEIFDKLPPEDKNHPLAYKTAVKDAALELDVKPKSRRKAESKADAYSYGSDAGSEKPSKKESKEISELTAEFARRVGVNIDDPKVAARIKNNHGKKSYTKWG